MLGLFRTAGVGAAMRRCEGCGGEWKGGVGERHVLSIQVSRVDDTHARVLLHACDGRVIDFGACPEEYLSSDIRSALAVDDDCEFEI